MTSRVWRPEKRVSAVEITELATEFEREEWSHFVVQLGKWERSDILADAYLQGLLGLLRRRGVSIEVKVPPQTFQGAKFEAAFSDTSPSSFPSLTPTETLLSRRVAGLILGQFSDFSPEHSFIPRVQVDRLRSSGAQWGSGNELAAAVIVSDRRVRRQESYGERYTSFLRRTRGLLQMLLGETELERFAGSDRRLTPDFHGIVTFGHEALENTYQHARLDFDAEPIRQVRFMQIRRLHVGGPGLDVQVVSNGLGPAFEQYFEFVSQRLPDWASGKSAVPFLELTIADGGLGIPALLANELDVYEKRSFEEERKYLAESLLPNTTTRAEGEPGRGQGFKKMLRVTGALSGFAVVRSGRCLASRTYVEEPDVDSLDFVNPWSDAFVPDFDDQQPLIAGTVVSLIFPLLRP